MTQDKIRWPIEAQWMLSNLICSIFDQANLRFHPEKMLKFAFRVKSRRREPLLLILWAPDNYVGVYVKDGGKPLALKSFHDSCWRSDGVDRFINESTERIEGFDPIETGGHAYQIVEGVSEEYQKVLRDLIRKRDERK